MMKADVTNRRKRQSGYVLFAVLACLLLAGFVSVRVARRSLSARRGSYENVQRLRSRWGAHSLRVAVLGEAPRILGGSEPVQRVPLSTVQQRVMLSGKSIQILLSDEDAKFNLNTVYHRVGLMETVQIIRQSGITNPLAVRLRPRVESMSTPLGLPAMDESEGFVFPEAFQSWGEVFDLTQFRNADLRTSILLPSVRTMTCWGQGRLHVRPASNEAILRIAELVTSQAIAQQLLDRIRAKPVVPVNRHILQLDIDLEQQTELKSLLSDSSSSFSLWVIDSESERMYVRLLGQEQEERLEKFMNF